MGEPLGDGGGAEPVFGVAANEIIQADQPRGTSPNTVSDDASNTLQFAETRGGT